MFKKTTKKITEQMISSAKEIVKSETVKKVDDILPKLVCIAPIIAFIFCKPKRVIQTKSEPPIILNFYNCTFRR